VLNARRLVLSVLGVSLGVLALVCASALAFNEHIAPPTSFGEACSGSPCGNGQFSEPGGIAVEQSTGDVYVVDTGNDRVEKFTAAGTFISSFGTSGSGHGQLDKPTWIAIGETGVTPVVYVSDTGNRRIEQFDPSTGAYVGELTGTSTGTAGALVPFSEVQGVAVDPSGNLWVAAGEDLDEFSATGALISMLINLNQNTYHNYAELDGLAVDSEDGIYGFHNLQGPHKIVGTPEGDVQKWTSTGVHVGEIDKDLSTGSYQDAGVAVDPGSAGIDGMNDLYVVHKLYDHQETGYVVSLYAPNCIQEPEFEESIPIQLHERDGCPELESFGLGQFGGNQGAAGGIAVSATTGAVYVVRPESGEVKVFAATVVPDVTVREASHAVSTSATLEGAVNADSTSVSGCHFEYVGEKVFDQAKKTEAEAKAQAKAAGERAAEDGVRAQQAKAQAEAFNTAGKKERAEEEEEKAKAYEEAAQSEEANVKSDEAKAAEQREGWGQASNAECEPHASSIVGGNPVAVQANVTGLTSAETYLYRLVAANASGSRESAVQTFVTSTAPTILEEFVLSIAPATSGKSVRASILAVIDPVGLETSYRVEYGPSTEAGYGSSTVEASAGNSVGPVIVTAQLDGLAPETTYHFRFVASNALGSGEGEEQTFRTASLSPASSLLPDGRSFEWVSTGNTRFGDVYVPYEAESEFKSGPPERASVSGESLTYGGPTESVAGNGNENDDFGQSYLATRSSSGWTASDITPPNTNITADYHAFSSDLTIGILQIVALAETGKANETPVIPGGPLAGGFLRLPDGSFSLLPGGEGKRNFIAESPYQGATPDFRHIVVQVNGGLYVYEHVTNKLSPAVNVLPGGTEVPEAKLEAISTDGGAVVWSGGGNLYVREGIGTSQERTLQVDAPQGGNGPGGGGAFAEGQFGESPDGWAKSFNGAQVLFTDSAGAGLTSDTAAGSGANLYELDLATDHLVDLTVAKLAEVRSVVGVSEDGSYVYFIATGVLTEGKNAEGKEPEAGHENLYVDHRGAIGFIAADMRGAQVTPDGLHFLAQSRSDALYVYDASTATLECSSCSGGRPVGVELGNDIPFGLNEYRIERYVPHWMSATGDRVFFQAGSLVPQATAVLNVYEWESDGTGTCQTSGGCIYLISGGSAPAQFIDASASGDDVFFTTRNSLVPEDKNDYVDVYDAHVGARPVSPPLCSGTGCQGVPPAAPIFATPSSVTFNGVGNFETGPTTVVKPKAKPAKCTKGKKRSHGKCVKSKSKKKRTKAKRAKRASNHRRAK
jgi:hypothetical protein